MKSVVLMLLLVGCASVSAQRGANERLPVTVISGHGLRLSDVEAIVLGGAIETNGWVRRPSTSRAPILAHLHIDYLNQAGAAFQTLEVKWMGDIKRPRHGARVAPFRVRSLISSTENISGVRVSVQSGPVHSE